MAELVAMPKYESYRDSGVERIGNIPVNWTVEKLKYCTFINKKSLPDTTPAKTVIKYVDIGSVSLENGIEKTEEYTFSDAPSRARRLVKSGDTVVSTVRTYLKAISYINHKFENCVYSTGFAVLTPKAGLDSKFLSSFIKSNAFTHQVDGIAKGMSYPAINSTELSNLYVVKASKKEQTSIANFLDKKTAQIDEAIAIKEKQIKLLKERKQIIIQQAVTQGLDTNAPMKDSGVDWIGEIPEHWEVRRAKYIFIKQSREVREEDGVVTCFRDGQVTLRANRRTEGFTFASKEHGYQGIRKGDLVIHAMDAFAGAIGVSDSDGKSSPVYSACTPQSNVSVNPKYYALYLRNLAVGGFIESLAKGIRERSTDFRFNDFSELFLPLPNINTQNAVVEHIESEHKGIDAGVQHLLHQIEKLKEYKTTLINSAVTGKIKVPEVDSGC